MSSRKLTTVPKSSAIVQNTTQSSAKKIKIFRLICDFVNNLLVEFEKEESVNAYKSLLLGTFNLKELSDFSSKEFSFNELNVVEKHNKAFYKFSEENKEALLERNENKIVSNITYSKTIFLDMKYLLSKTSSKENKLIIWRYLISFLALFTESDEAAKAVKEINSSSNEEFNMLGNNFLSEIMNEIESMGINFEDPVAAIMTLISSGTINKAVSIINEKFSNDELSVKDIRRSLNSLLDKYENLTENKTE